MHEAIRQFLRSHNRCVITSSLNCAIVLYEYIEPDILLFISKPSSIHIAACKEFEAKEFSDKLLARAAYIKQIAPISVGIYDENKLEGICAQAMYIKANKQMQEKYLARYKMAKFALGHEIYALRICYLKYKNLAFKKEYFLKDLIK